MNLPVELPSLGMQLWSEMRAAVLQNIGELVVQDVDSPNATDGNVLIQVRACGVCGSDVPRILSTGTYQFPTIPGHELAGEVIAVGSGVDPDLMGRRCAVIPLIPCRKCEICELGLFALCCDYDFLGSRRDGGFAEMVSAPADNLVSLPDSMDWISGAMLEPVTVALHVLRRTSFRYGATAVVFGLGTVGSLVAQWCRAFGAAQVIGVDIDSRKLELARELGITALNSADSNVFVAVAALTEGRGVEFAFETSGAARALAKTTELVGVGGTIGLVGRPASAVTLEPDSFERLLRKQLTVMGSWSFEFTRYPRSAWHEAVAAIAAGRIRCQPLVSHRIGLDGILATVKQMQTQSGGITKAVVLP